MIDVIVVEDTASTAELYAQLLLDRGLSTKIFTQSGAAIEWLRVSQPKAVLLDKRFLESDGSRQRLQGLDVLRFISQYCPTVPCIIVTADPGGTDDFVMGTLKAQYFFNKFEAQPNEIIDAVCEAIKSDSLRARRDQIVLAAEATCHGIVSALAAKGIKNDIESLIYISDTALARGRSQSGSIEQSYVDSLQQLGAIALRINRTFDKLREANPRFTNFLDESAATLGQTGMTGKTALVGCSPRAIASEITSLVQIACSGLAVSSEIVQVRGDETIVMIDEFFGTQLIYLALRLALERVRGQPSAKVVVDAGTIDRDNADAIISFVDNGGEFPAFQDPSTAYDRQQQSAPYDWWNAQFTAIRCLARLHGGDAAFGSTRELSGQSGLATRIRLPGPASRQVSQD